MKNKKLNFFKNWNVLIYFNINFLQNHIFGTVSLSQVTNNNNLNIHESIDNNVYFYSSELNFNFFSVTNFSIFVLFFLMFFSGTVVMTNKPVVSLIGLLLAFFFGSLLLFIVQAEFYALVIIVLYIGAIIMLFLFVIMMVNIQGLQNLSLISITEFRFFNLIIFLQIIIFILSICFNTFLNVPSNQTFSELKNFTIWNLVNYINSDIDYLVYTFYNEYAIFLILISLILLVAMVGSVIICSIF